ncbi:hypothetical protein F5I97DRAFT_1829656 [Phlebopus sp. FC_14]|nr:hypothetical protein F5I97DRAFT_1829656 [Phlebopus sp. FC_14]
MPAASPRLSPKPKGSSRAKSNAQTPIPATYQIDIVQTVRVTSNEPLTRDKFDQIKKRLENVDRGYSFDDDKLNLTQISLEVVDGLSHLPRPHSASPEGPTRQQRRILFYHAHDPYYGFTNFSPDPVEYQGKTYPTSEHLFQTYMEYPNISFYRIALSWPSISERARKDLEWFSMRLTDSAQRIQMMDVVLYHKFTQNKHLRSELLSTGDSELVEDSDKDAFWGIGPNGNGENQLGKALQRLRSKLQDESY